MILRICFTASLITITIASIAVAEEPLAGPTPFARQQLTDTYYSEGANAGDLNQDGKPDIVYGPYWYEGPDFTQSHEIYPPKPQPLDFYADNFFSWVYDFNRDGWNDVFVVGFPGTPAFVYENPGQSEDHWPKHQVFDSVSNESPHFTQLSGDERPELICTRGGLFGFATLPKEGGFGAWTFHAISDQAAPERFGHGLGVGDVNGDKRLDILTAGGWFEQPASDAESARWTFHEVKFTNSYGGAEMYAYDIDGDGDNDIITSLSAHDFGLAWYEQDTSGPQTVFREHLIMGKTPEQNRYGVLFTELHSVALADMNQDGVLDIVTGKTYWSHHKQSPLWDAGAVIYWFELVRTPNGVDWLPHQLDGEAGIGRQLIVSDINGDQRPDVVVGGMKGAHVLTQPDELNVIAPWKAASANTAPLQRAKSPLSESVTQIRGALEGESITGVEVTDGQASTQEMSGFTGDRWSAKNHLFWTGGKVGSRMTIPVEVTQDGDFDISAAFTMAPDYALVRVLLDDDELRSPLDFYNAPDVLSTGPLKLGTRKLAAGKHSLTIEITGANPSAAPGLMVGLDYIVLKEVQPR